MPILTAALAGVFVMVLLSSCSTLPSVLALPSDVALDKSIGRGMILSTKIRTEDGREFPCFVDTGSPITSVPAALEPMLGKQLGIGVVTTLDSPSNQPVRLYAAPKLYLGTTRLVTGTKVDTGGGANAILGMDCLRHYCIQLDFTAGKMRFLDPEHLDTAGLGTPYRLVRSRYAMIRRSSFFGEAIANLLIDTGYPFDGCLTPERFGQAAQEHKGKPIPLSVDGVVKGDAKDLAEFAECSWDGVKYSDLVIGKGPLNLLGMRFLGRHLVTFNFPKGVMYLKLRSTTPLK